MQGSLFQFPDLFLCKRVFKSTRDWCLEWRLPHTQQGNYLGWVRQARPRPETLRGNICLGPPPRPAPHWLSLLWMWNDAAWLKPGRVHAEGFSLGLYTRQEALVSLSMQFTHLLTSGRPHCSPHHCFIAAPPWPINTDGTAQVSVIFFKKQNTHTGTHKQWHTQTHLHFTSKINRRMLETLPWAVSLCGRVIGWTWWATAYKTLPKYWLFIYLF